MLAIVQGAHEIEALPIKQQQGDQGVEVVRRGVALLIKGHEDDDHQPCAHGVVHLMQTK